LRISKSHQILHTHEELLFKTHKADVICRKSLGLSHL